MADRLTVEHYIGKCFEKCAQIVLGSRVYQVEENKASQDKRSAQWVRFCALDTAERIPNSICWLAYVVWRTFMAMQRVVAFSPHGRGPNRVHCLSYNAS